MKTPGTFAESQEGQTLLRLHDLGYRLANDIASMTPLQREFLVAAVNKSDADAEERAQQARRK